MTIAAYDDFSIWAVGHSDAEARSMADAKVGYPGIYQFAPIEGNFAKQIARDGFDPGKDAFGIKNGILVRRPFPAHEAIVPSEARENLTRTTLRDLITACQARGTAGDAEMAALLTRAKALIPTDERSAPSGQPPAGDDEPSYHEQLTSRLQPVFATFLSEDLAAGLAREVVDHVLEAAVEPTEGMINEGESTPWGDRYPSPKAARSVFVAMMEYARSRKR